MKLPPVKARVLSEQVVVALREAIVKGELPPGHHLVETDIAEQMGVSRGPAREAIRQLDQEGLVELFPHRGALVVGMSEDELDAVYEMRATIEAFAIARASTMVNQAQMAVLETLLAEMEQHQASRSILPLVEADVRFHEAILEASGYAFLKRRWDPLDGIIRVRTIQALDRPGPLAEHLFQDTVHSHRVLADAMKAGDAERAAVAVREHILAATGIRRVPFKGP